MITGAGGVLGGSIARSFAMARAKVVVLDIRQESIDNRVAELKALGGEAIGLHCNILEMGSMQQAVDLIVSQVDGGFSAFSGV